MSADSNQRISKSHGDDSPSLRSVPILSEPVASRRTTPVSATKLAPLGPLSLTPKPFQKETPTWGVREEWSASTPAWVVCAEDLEPLPLDFPLEKTHRQVYDDPSVVSSRIANALRKLSIESTFCQESAKVSCRTEDCVSLKIRMFAGGEGGQPIIVEVQKRSGPAFCFLRTCRALLNAAEGKDLRHSCSASLSKVFPPPVGQMKCLKNAIKEPASEDVEEKLSTVNRLLYSKRMDEHLLALEDLICLTDPIKSSPLIAIDVARALLKDDVLRNNVLLIFKPNFQVMPLRNYADKALHLSLAVLANACCICGSKGYLRELVETDCWFTDTFLPLLLSTLSQAHDHSIGAYEAARSLHSLLTCEPNQLVEKIADANGRNILRGAYEYGCQHNELLEHETKRCLDELQQSSAVAT